MNVIQKGITAMTTLSVRTPRDHTIVLVLVDMEETVLTALVGFYVYAKIKSFFNSIKMNISKF